MIDIDIPSRSINVRVSDEELTRRRVAMEARGKAAWQPEAPRKRKVTTPPRLDPDARNPDASNEAEKTNARHEKRAAFVEAHELAMRAARFLDPERGDKRTAAECLRRALEALEAAE